MVQTPLTMKPQRQPERPSAPSMVVLRAPCMTPANMEPIDCAMVKKPMRSATSCGMYHCDMTVM